MSIEYPCVHWDKGKCKKFSDDSVTSWCVWNPCASQTPSNADKIRSMSDEELAMRLYEIACDGIGYGSGWFTPKGTLKWLQQPAEENKNGV